MGDIFLLKYGKLLLILSSYILLGILVLHPALRIVFLGDFAGDILNSQRNWFDFAPYQWNFYIPVMMVYYGLYKIFHLSPLFYHVFHLSLICINALLVYILAQELKFESWQCWIAGLLALFNSAAFETYFWLSTIPKVLATSFGLLALIFLSQFRQKMTLVWGWGYVMMVTLGLTMESTGLILPLLGLLLDLYFRPWRGSGKERATLLSGLRLHLWTFGIAGLYLLMRHFLGIRLYAENFSMIWKCLTFIRTAFSTFFHGLENYFWFESTGIVLISIILTLLLSAILILVLKKKQGPDRRRYIILLLLWGGACLPHTIGAHYNSRYLYFPAVFCALVLVDVLGSLRLRFYARDCTWLMVLIVISGYLCLDCFAFHQTLNSYLEASRIYDAGIQKIKTQIPEMPSGSRLVLIDFPGYIYRPRTSYQGYQFKYRVLVYKCALPSHLILLYKSENFTVTFLTLSPQDRNNCDNPSPMGTPATPEQLAALLAQPQTVTCRYLPGTPGDFVILRDTLAHDSPITK
jgi:hypothetical protein